MLTFYDRLYGKLELPEIVWELATSCPVLLRLREVRMANIPFLTHPSFANVDRYEHSLGVAHLAWRWAKQNSLAKDIGIGLTIAALYHDGATPAFGHLFEEFLARYGFDHEATLVDLLNGNPDELPGRGDVQVYLGERCRLRSVIPRPSAANASLTIPAIANLASGNGPLGRLVKGDIDFDNIDNVIRAVTAMGVISANECVHPYAVIDAIEFSNGQVGLKDSGRFAIAAWSHARRLLYDAILENNHEFRAQTAIKWAIEEASVSDADLRTPAAWKYTEPMLVFEHLQRIPFSRHLIERVRLAKPPPLLFTVWMEDLSPLIGSKGTATMCSLRCAISEILNMEVYINFYVDKRARTISLPESNGPSQLLLPIIPSNSRNEDQSNPTSRHRSGSTSGVVGVVGISKAERLHCDRSQAAYWQSGSADTDLAIKRPEGDALLREFRRLAGRKEVVFKGGRADMREHSEQQRPRL